MQSPRPIAVGFLCLALALPLWSASDKDLAAAIAQAAVAKAQAQALQSRVDAQNVQIAAAAREKAALAASLQTAVTALTTKNSATSTGVVGAVKQAAAVSAQVGDVATADAAGAAEAARLQKESTDTAAKKATDDAGGARSQANQQLITSLTSVALQLILLVGAVVAGLFTWSSKRADIKENIRQDELTEKHHREEGEAQSRIEKKQVEAATKLGQVHVAVNGGLLAVKKRLLASLKSQLFLAHIAAKHDPSAEADEAVMSVQSEINDLEIELVDLGIKTAEAAKVLSSDLEIAKLSSGHNK